jgi:hypothetical protein
MKAVVHHGGGYKERHLRSWPPLEAPALAINSFKKVWLKGLAPRPPRCWVAKQPPGLQSNLLGCKAASWVAKQPQRSGGWWVTPSCIGLQCTARDGQQARAS